MNLDFLLRIVGGVALAIVGWQVEVALQGHSPAFDITLLVSLTLSGFGLGLLLTPDLTIRPFQRFRSFLGDLSDEEIFSGAIGLLIALVMSALSALPLSLLPSPMGKLAPFAMALLFAYFGISIGVARRRRMLSMLNSKIGAVPYSDADAGSSVRRHVVLIDTSAIIDGRIIQISRTGFIPGGLVIPQFVLDELQHLGDSSDPRRRTSGRHGLDNLARIKEESVVPVEIDDFADDPNADVDHRLLSVAKRLDCPIVTTDWNLNRVAGLQGVPVLNINVLYEALRPPLGYGDKVRLFLVEQGAQSGQARGYLDDGTMVVVENGQSMLGKEVDVVIQRVRQQDSGRIIFAVMAVPEPIGA
jgi:uncharacterized protein YacL